MGLPPQLKLLAVFSRKSGHNNMSEQCNQICPYRKYEHTQFHSGTGTQTQTDCAYIFLSLNPVMFRVTTNGDLCEFLRSCGFSLSRAIEKWPLLYVNVTIRNTLAVLYNINSSTIILPQHQHYICGRVWRFLGGRSWMWRS